ncbi:PTI1-like tyrosine-protein kinase At3g15890 isoform X2 [Papaver somniferum]|uniref:PTI1-like tyrosine-protein kinase At3g15890 isoform X2 n=1 Tax=Papaver somniferum TaxID=3469 RepID=UPI000E703F6F|nr:PTI1-like tyrosine-protein kinase At3g15890 isoform X2 [Papaver somniferum]
MGSSSSCCAGEKVDEGGGFSPNVGAHGWRIFTYKELNAATNGFSEDNKLGEGGFGSVYWGKTSDGLQFASEVQLDWKRRMDVIIGSAEGLLYLHQEVTPHIIHRDIKASNVLLDSNFDPLVADFGFAKLIPDGYLAPEYAMFGRVSESCDVYSLGILVLEILTGRKPIERLPGGVKRTITEWAEPYIMKGRFKDLADPKLRGNFDINQLKQAINVAALCVQTDPENRPNMKEVVKFLKGSDGKDKILEMRIDSVKYRDDQGTTDDDNDNDNVDRRGKVVGDESDGYGVFGAMEIQKMNDPYVRKNDGSKRIFG